MTPEEMLAELGIPVEEEIVTVDEPLYGGVNYGEDVKDIAGAALTGTVFLFAAMGWMDVPDDQIETFEKVVSAGRDSLAEMIVEASARYGLTGETVPNADA